MKDSTASILIVGNEVLSGEVEEANIAFLIDRFRALGVALKRITVCPDEIDIIAKDVQTLSREHDIVITTGGVGPTHDDVTLDAVALAFDRKLVRHAGFASKLKNAYGDHLTEQGLTMADLPQGTEMVGEETLKVPVVRVENVYIFPGIPGLLRDKFIAIEERFRQRPFWVRRVVVLSEESTVAKHLGLVQEAHPEVSLGSYPRFREQRWEVKLTVECRDPEVLNNAFDDLVKGLPSNQIKFLEPEPTTERESP